MIKVPYFDDRGERQPDLEVDEKRLGVEKINRVLLKEVAVMYEANRRRGTHSTRTRGEVAHSNNKPWRQKGTGRARAGTRNSPIWRGGGVALGPKPRDYSYRMPRKMLSRARAHALLSKLTDGEVAVVDAPRLESPKTKVVAALLKRVEFEKKAKRGKILVASAGHDPVFHKSLRNLEGASLMAVADLNAYELLTHRYLLLTRAAFDRLFGAADAAPGEGQREEKREPESSQEEEKGGGED